MTDFRVHVGEIMSGRITDTIPVTGLRWSDTLNGNGSIDSVTVAGSVVRDRNLRQKTYGGRCFLAVERDGRILQAGPIWSSSWNWEQEVLTLGASGMWSLADRRIVHDDASFNNGGILTFTGSLGGIAVGLISHMLNRTPPYTNLPIVLPAIESGSETEAFARWEMQRYGDALRKITQQAIDAPDIAFRARRRGDDPRFLEWLMMAGTVDAPSLSQGGPDWVFDTTLPKSPVLGISTDEDASQMGTFAWATGNGSEADMKMVTSVDPALTLFNAGWPYIEVDESHPTVDDYPTLTGLAENLQVKVGRPVEVYKVQVSADYARDVRPGDYCQVITKAPVKQPDGSWSAGANWLGDMNRRMRVKTVSGDLSDVFTLDMFPLAALL